MKKVILVVALFVPIAVFIFFKIFGKNEFDVPVYWSDGVTRNIPGCGTYPTPYVLPDSVLNKFQWRSEAKATLLIIDADKTVLKNITRVDNLFENGAYDKLTLENIPFEIKTCALLAGDSSKVLLIDDQKRIRGYYTPTTQKETDRLEVELKILLKQY